MPKHKKSDEFIESDSETDSSGSDAEVKKKKKKEEEKKKKVPEKKQKEESASSEDEKSVWDLGRMRRVYVNEFKGNKLIHIREYYTDKSTGEEKPGKKGITLKPDEWKKLLAIGEKVTNAI